MDLEAVDVEDAASERLGVTLGACELGVETLVEVEERVRVGESVVPAKALEPVTRSLHAVVRSFDAQRGRDTNEELRLLERLADVAVSADLQRLDAALRVRLREHEGDGDEVVGEPADRPARGLTAQTRHHRIEEDDIDAASRDALDRGLSVRRRLDLVAARAQGRRDHLERRRIVIGDEHASGALVLVDGRAARPRRHVRRERRAKHGRLTLGRGAVLAQLDVGRGPPHRSPATTRRLDTPS